MSEEKNIPIMDEEEFKEAVEAEAEAAETPEADGAESTEKLSEETSDEVSSEETVSEESAEAGTSEAGDAADDKDQQLQEMNAKYLRLMADFQNQKKRYEKEKSDLYKYAGEDLAKNILEVLDNFDRALDGEVCAEDSKFKDGMELIFKQLVAALEKAGVKEIPALGEEFDPNFHNAVMMEDSEEYESNKVSGVMQKGYTLKDKVIRPSMVKVAK